SLRGGGADQGGRLAQHAADHPGEKIGQTVRRLQRLESRLGARRSEIVRPDLPAAPARRCLPAGGALLDLRQDAAVESPAVPRPSLEPLPERRLRVDAGDEETAGG